MVTTLINVLDKGSVRLLDSMGTDIDVVNAARVSYDKQSAVMTAKDERLIQFLAGHDHSSPFRHQMLKFEVYAPLIVARQWWRYVIGSSHQDNMMAWNESSRRYVTEEPVFYVPTEWRAAPANKKQGSGDNLPLNISEEWTCRLNALNENALSMYEGAMAAGVAPEQARLFLPAYSMYVRWIWTTSLQGVLHFLDQRLKPDAQYEIREFAKAVEVFVQEKFPISYAAWNATGKSTTVSENSGSATSEKSA